VISTPLTFTALAPVDPLRKRHLLAVSAAVTLLRGVGGVDLHDSSTGAFSLEEEKCEEQRPTGVGDGLGKAMVVNHPVHFQVFDGDEPEPVNDSPGGLIGEVVASERNPFVNPGNGLASLPPFRCPFLGLGELPLHLRQFLFIGAEESGIVDRFTVRSGGQCGRRRQPNIDTHLKSVGGKQGWLGNLTRKADVPLARRTPAKRTRLRRPFEWAVKHKPNRADLGENQLIPSTEQPEGH